MQTIARIIVLVLIAAELQDVEEHRIQCFYKFQTGSVRSELRPDLLGEAAKAEGYCVVIYAREFYAGYFKRRYVEGNCRAVVAQSIEQMLHAD